MMDGKSILIFGAGSLQESIITKAKKLGFTTIAIDPNPDAVSKHVADHFECIPSHDFEKTCQCVEKYNIQGIVTSATDKPLRMMARVAEKYNFRFFSYETASITTDKYLMKLRLQQCNIPCADGYLVNIKKPVIKKFPVILKPIDNSGSRGVIYCHSADEVNECIKEIHLHTNHTYILCEEFITGKEYSVEAVHTQNETYVIAVTEKFTVPRPYFAEIGHIVPAPLSGDTYQKIINLIKQIAACFQYKYCASHTEIKINEHGIFVIETSPRPGGDYITSHLVTRAFSFDIEEAVLKMSAGINENIKSEFRNYCGIFYLQFPEGKIEKIDRKRINDLFRNYQVIANELSLFEGMYIRPIKNSLDRYGFFIIESNDYRELLKQKDHILQEISQHIIISKHVC